MIRMINAVAILTNTITADYKLFYSNIALIVKGYKQDEEVDQ